MWVFISQHTMRVTFTLIVTLRFALIATIPMNKAIEGNYEGMRVKSTNFYCREIISPQ